MNKIDGVCCANCGKEKGGASLKACTACKLVKYCNVNCQRNHWQKHKKECKRHATEIRVEALFNDPPAKEDCPICFLPMPVQLVCCVSLPPATISSVPIYDYAEANEELTNMRTLARHVADVSPTCRQILADIACRCDTEEAPTQFSSITADKFKSAQTYELATLP